LVSIRPAKITSLVSVTPTIASLLRAAFETIREVLPLPLIANTPWFSGALSKVVKNAMDSALLVAKPWID